MKKHIVNLLAGLALVGGLSAGGAAQAGFSMTEIQFHYGDDYKMGRNANFPTFNNTTKRETITLEHFSTNDIGDLFFFVDFFHDENKLTPDTGDESDQYGEIYYHFHGSQFGLNFGDSSFITALDLGVSLNQGTDFSVALVGPRLSFNIPGFQFFTLGVYAYDNFDDPFNRNLDTTYQVTMVWNAPFDIGSQKFSVQGFVDFIGSQGSGVDDQIVFSPQLRWDIGHAMGAPDDKINMGIEYTHFDNKFGVTGVDEDSYSVFVAFKF